MGPLTECRVISRTFVLICAPELGDGPAQWANFDPQGSLLCDVMGLILCFDIFSDGSFFSSYLISIRFGLRMVRSGIFAMHPVLLLVTDMSTSWYLPFCHFSGLLGACCPVQSYSYLLWYIFGCRWNDRTCLRSGHVVLPLGWLWSCTGMPGLHGGLGLLVHVRAAYIEICAPLWRATWLDFAVARSCFLHARSCFFCHVYAWSSWLSGQVHMYLGELVWSAGVGGHLKDIVVWYL